MDRPQERPDALDPQSPNSATGAPPTPDKSDEQGRTVDPVTGVPPEEARDEASDESEPHGDAPGNAGPDGDEPGNAELEGDAPGNAGPDGDEPGEDGPRNEEPSKVGSDDEEFDEPGPDGGESAERVPIGDETSKVGSDDEELGEPETDDEDPEEAPSDSGEAVPDDDASDRDGPRKTGPDESGPDESVSRGGESKGEEPGQPEPGHEDDTAEDDATPNSEETATLPGEAGAKPDSDDAAKQADDPAPASSSADETTGNLAAPMAPIDVQTIALALVEAATQDAARVSPPLTQAPTEPRESLTRPPVPPTATSPEQSGSGQPAPQSADSQPTAHRPASERPADRQSADPRPADPPSDVPEVPPFPMPVAPQRSSANSFVDSAKDAVVGRARRVRGWWTGVGPNGERTGDPGKIAARNRKMLIGTVSGVVVLTLAYTISAWARADVVPDETTVAGVDVGEMTTDEAATALAEGLKKPAIADVKLVAGEATTTMDPKAAGLSVDAAATAESLTGFSLSPARMWQHWFGGAAEAPVVTVNDEAFASTVSGLEESMVVPPVDGTVAFAKGEPVATPPTSGTEIDPQAVRSAITASWLVTDGPIELPTRTVEPDVTAEETETALADASQIVSGSVVVQVGGQEAKLEPKTLASAVTYVKRDGALAARFDDATLIQAIVDKTDNLLETSDGAQFSFENGKPEIVGGDLGTTLQGKATRVAIREAALGADRTATLDVVQQTPENSTAALEALGVKEIVAEFATPLTSDYSRTLNLIRGAEMVTGDLIRPKETYSLIEALSPISLANGYYLNGMIVGGQHVDGVGGGLSQMATTSFNAAMAAGFEDVEHHPHSYWFERYPAGHEATIAVPTKDMVVRNNTPYGAVLQSWVADGQLYVRIWSTKYYENVWEEGDKRNVVPPGVVTSTDPGCAAYPGGQAGFTITNGRTVTRIDDGKVVIEDSYTTSYAPDHARVCSAPAPPPEAPESED